MPDKSDRELLRRIEDAVASMARVERDIFLAHRLEHMSYAEIARATGITIRQVERHIARAIARLSKQLDGEPPGWWERWF